MSAFYLQMIIYDAPMGATCQLLRALETVFNCSTADFVLQQENLYRFLCLSTRKTEASPWQFLILSFLLFWQVVVHCKVFCHKPSEILFNIHGYFCQCISCSQSADTFACFTLEPTYAETEKTNTFSADDVLERVLMAEKAKGWVSFPVCLGDVEKH